jgi:hypothetical protein
LTKLKGDEIYFLKNEKQKLEREIEFMTKDVNDLTGKLTKEREATNKLEKVRRQFL